MNTLTDIFTPEALRKLFPPQRTNEFFEALFGDADDGAYDISLAYRGNSDKQLSLEFLLRQRPGQCLVCSLTRGLPPVFSRHPIINVEGLARDIDKLAAGRFHCTDWQLGETIQENEALHRIPLTINIAVA
ncbi:MAG TPA: pancreas/duodenum homeobox protein 1 [Desulfobulbaceae bacterium]|nr:pancreas/duodenum homeobox protein 1 [Desulfobulbaceae bacterium]